MSDFNRPIVFKNDNGNEYCYTSTSQYKFVISNLDKFNKPIIYPSNKIEQDINYNGSKSFISNCKEFNQSINLEFTYFNNYKMVEGSEKFNSPVNIVINSLNTTLSNSISKVCNLIYNCSNFNAPFNLTIIPYANNYGPLFDLQIAYCSNFNSNIYINAVGSRISTDYSSGDHYDLKGNLTIIANDSASNILYYNNNNNFRSFFGNIDLYLSSGIGLFTGNSNFNLNFVQTKTSDPNTFGINFINIMNGLSSFNCPVNFYFNYIKSYTNIYNLIIECYSFNSPANLFIEKGIASYKIYNFIQNCRSFNAPVNVIGNDINIGCLICNCPNFCQDIKIYNIKDLSTSASSGIGLIHHSSGAVVNYNANIFLGGNNCLIDTSLFRGYNNAVFKGNVYCSFSGDCTINTLFKSDSIYKLGSTFSGVPSVKYGTVNIFIKQQPGKILNSLTLRGLLSNFVNSSGNTYHIYAFNNVKKCIFIESNIFELVNQNKSKYSTLVNINSNNFTLIAISSWTAFSDELGSGYYNSASNIYLYNGFDTSMY